MTHITFLFAWLFSLPPLNKKMPFYIFSFWILLLFLALRHNYGTDYGAYYLKHKYAYVVSESFWEQEEILFSYLNILFGNFYLLIAVISLFYILTIHRLVRKSLSVKYYWMAILFWLINPYLFLIHLSGIRQTLAMCFFIFAVQVAIKRKISAYIIFIIIAAGFHQSALLLLPIYFFLSEKKLKKSTIIAIFGLLGALLTTPLFNLILNQVITYYPKYSIYIETAQQNSIRSIILTSFIFFIIILNINKLEGKEMIYGRLALLATCISLLSIKLNMIGRVGMYFDIFLIVAIPLIISKIKTKVYRQLVFLIVLGIYSLRYVSFFTNYTSFYKYQTILGF